MMSSVILHEEKRNEIKRRECRNRKYINEGNSFYFFLFFVSTKNKKKTQITQIIDRTNEKHVLFIQCDNNLTSFMYSIML